MPGLMAVVALSVSLLTGGLFCETLPCDDMLACLTCECDCVVVVCYKRMWCAGGTNDVLEQSL